jgi:hypothetical protein
MSKNFKVKNGLEVTTNVTASGDISSSGTITMLTASIGGGIFTSASLAAGGGGGGSMDNFTLTADGGSNQTIADGNTLDIAGGDGITTAVGATDTVTVNVDASQDGHISSILTTDLKLGEDAQTKIDFETNNEIHFDVNNAELFNMTGNQLSGSGVSTGSFGRLDATSLPNIGYANFTGSVGIGTTSPGEKLEVIGNISASGDITANELNLTGSSAGMTIFNTSGTEILFNKTTGHAANITSQDAMFLLAGASKNMFFGANNVNSQVVLNDGNLSIGAGNSPAQKLVVHGDAHITGSISGSAASTGSFGRVDATSLPNIGYANFTGSVGIGTTSPGEKLEVVGNISASGEIQTNKIQFPIPTSTTANGIFFKDTSSNAPHTNINVIQWDFSNDDAFIYAHQSSSDGTYLVNELRDNTSTDKFVWWFNNFAGATTDSFPLMLEGNKAVVNYIKDKRVTFHRDSGATNGAANNVDFYLLKSGSTSVSEANSLIFGDVSTSEVTMNGALEVTGNISGSATSTGSFGRIEGSGSTDITGKLAVGGVANFNGSFVNIGGGFGSTGVSIAADGDIQTNGTLTADGNISSSGKITGDDFEFNLPTDNGRKFRGLTNAGVRLHDSSGGWAMAYGFQGNDERDLGGFGAFGGGSLEYFYVGNHYQRGVMTIHSGSTNGVMIGSGIGETNPPKTLTVAGEISASGNITTPSTGSFGSVAGTLSTAAQPNITSLGTLTTLTVDDITINGSTISDGGDFTLDVEGDITLDANGADIILSDDGTDFGRFKRDSSDFIIKSEANNKDIVFRGQDGGATITALTLDMSEAGKAIFTGDISSSGTITGLSASFQSADINGGTIDGITSLTVANNIDIGPHGFRALQLQDDSLTNTRVVFAGSSGVLSDNSKFTFASDKLSIPSLNVSQSAGIGISIEQPTTALVTARFDSDRFRFWAGGSERLTILSASGHVGIGNASPAKELTVNGEISASGNITTPSTGSVGNLIATTIEGTLADSSRTDINSILATDLVLGEDAQTKIDFGTANIIKFFANNSEKMTISDTGVVIDGDITAQQYIVNSTVTNVTQSFSSGSTIFGDTPADDTHQFTGSVSVTGSITAGTLDAAAVTDGLAAAIVAEIDNDEIPIAKLAEDAITIAGSSTQLGGSITADTIAGQISADTISGNQINGGTIGSVTISALAGNLSLGDNNITNVGDINCDSISIDAAGTGLDIVFGGNTTKNKITLTDNLADALNITEGSNSYIKFTTTNNDEEILFSENTRFTNAITASGDISSSGNIIADGIKATLPTGTDNSVVILDSDGFLKTDEIDGKVFDAIVGSAGGGNFGSSHDNKFPFIDDGDQNTLDPNSNLKNVTGGVEVTGDLKTSSHITASGNISASGTITAATLDAAAVSDGLAAAIVAEIDNDEIPIAKLAQDAVTITAGDGLKTGGSVTLGSSVTLDIDVSDFAGTGLSGDGSENLNIDAAQTGINSILATDLVLGEDDQTKIDFETANEIHFDINNSELFNMTGNELSGSDSSTGSFASLNVRGSVQDNLTVDGTLFATKKSFLIPRPEGGKLEYGVLEGQQNDVFYRGKLKGDNVIYLPKEWEWLVDENTITVQLTSIGNFQELFVKEIKDNKIFIHVNGAFKTKKDIHCYHIIHGTRKDVELIRNYQ